jgi:guanylate kinase
MQRRGQIFIITGPSGAGKTTIAQALLKKVSSLKKVITCTTRPPREGEKDGADYRFIPRDKFEFLIDRRAFAEQALVYGNYYGSLKEDVEELLSKWDALFVVDVQGAVSLAKTYPEAKTIFVKTPTLEVLGERLRERGKDSEEVIKKRLSEAKEELKLEKKFNFVIVNDKLADAVNKTKKLVVQK